MTVDHFSVFGKLAMCYCDVSIDHYSFQTQTLEESESQDRIAAQDLPHQHVLVVYLENFYGDVCREDHRQRSSCAPTDENGQKKPHAVSVAGVSRSVNSLLCWRSLSRKDSSFASHRCTFFVMSTMRLSRLSELTLLYGRWCLGLRHFFLLGRVTSEFWNSNEAVDSILTTDTKQRTNARNFVKKVFFTHFQRMSPRTRKFVGRLT